MFNFLPPQHRITVAQFSITIPDFKLSFINPQAASSSILCSCHKFLSLLWHTIANADALWRHRTSTIQNICSCVYSGLHRLPQSPGPNLLAFAIAEMRTLAHRDFEPSLCISDARSAYV